MGHPGGTDLSWGARAPPWPPLATPLLRWCMQSEIWCNILRKFGLIYRWKSIPCIYDMYGWFFCINKGEHDEYPKYKHYFTPSRRGSEPLSGRSMIYPRPSGNTIIFSWNFCIDGIIIIGLTINMYIWTVDFFVLIKVNVINISTIFHIRRGIWFN